MTRRLERTLAWLCFSVCLLALAPVAALAQPAATLRGTVTDSGGKPLPNATLTLTGPTPSKAVSGADGSFAFSGLAPGTYALDVVKGGFKNQTFTGITVPATAPLALTLNSASLSDLRQIGAIAVNRKTSLNTSPSAEASVSSQDYLNQSQPQINALLDQLPGVELNRFDAGTPGANTAVSIRGAASYETQDLIDGHPVSTGTDGDYLTNFLNSLVFDGVDVLKGPGTLTNTIGNAVGGTINFRTPSISRTLTASAVTGYDSFNGSYYAARVSDTIGKLGFLVDAGFYGTPGYQDNLAVPFVYNYATNGQGSNYPNAPSTISDTFIVGQTYQNRAQVFKLDYNFSPTTTLTLGSISSQTYNDESGTLDNYDPALIVPCIDLKTYSTTCTPGDYYSYNNPKYGGDVGKIVDGFYGYGPEFETNNEPIYTADLRSGFGSATLLARYYAGSIYRTVNNLADGTTVQNCGDPACSAANATFLQPYLETQHDLLHGFDAQVDQPFGSNALTFGFDRHTDNTTSCQGDPFIANPSDGGFNCLNSQGNVSNTTIASTTYSLRALLQLAPKARLDIGNYLSNASFIGTRYDPRLGFTYRLAPNAVLRASYGSTYVLPYAGFVTQEPYVSRNTFYPATSAIKPETSSGYDLGTDVFFGRYGKVGVDLYNTLVFDRFDSFTLPSTGTFDGQAYKFESLNGNVSNSREAGVELTIDEAPPVGFGFHGAVDLNRTYAFNVSDALSGNANGVYAYLVNGEQLSGFPFSKERAEAFYTTATHQVIRFGATSYGQWNAFGEPGFTVFDGSLSTPVRYGIRAQVTATNIFNHDDGRVFSEYGYGYIPAQTSGGVYPTSLLFTQPRTITFQLSRQFGP
jgi:outer membrane cobalamin receptor